MYCWWGGKAAAAAGCGAGASLGKVGELAVESAAPIVVVVVGISSGSTLNRCFLGLLLLDCCSSFF